MSLGDLKGVSNVEMLILLFAYFTDLIVSKYGLMKCRTLIFKLILKLHLFWLLNAILIIIIIQYLIIDFNIFITHFVLFPCVVHRRVNFFSKMNSVFVFYKIFSYCIYLIGVQASDFEISHCLKKLFWRLHALQRVFIILIYLINKIAVIVLESMTWLNFIFPLQIILIIQFLSLLNIFTYIW